MADLVAKVVELRDQGLTDDLIIDELSKQGSNPSEINEAISQADAPQTMGTPPPMSFPGSSYSSYPSMQEQPAQDDVYGRIEEISENIINEKWDELIKEVKKIIDWKEKVEEKQMKMSTELDKLKEDFSVLHQGVLGKLDTYDERMRDVGTELQAVGKVFKDVVPEFVENVKELSRISGKKKY
jgi:hypothetical protein